MIDLSELWSIFINWLWSIFFYSSVIVHDDVNKKIPYEYKYIEKFDALKKQNSEEIKDNACLKNLFIMDNTPYGNVIIQYDTENNMFLYYCDKNGIPFKYLETVSRKFVINNHCLNIYVDIRDELRKKEYDVEIVDLKEGENEDGVKNERIKNVFATFKNKAGPKNKNNKKVVFKENINKYKYMGKLDQFVFFEKNHSQFKKNNCINIKNPETISFTEFKKMN